METIQAKKRIHPLMAGAAISVMLVSMVGAAAILGYLPKSHSTPSPDTSVPVAETGVTTATAPSQRTAPAPLAHRKPAATPRSEPAHYQSTPSSQQAQTAPNYSQPVQQPVQHPVQQPAAQNSYVGMATGALIGGVLGNQVGHGRGKALATVVGAVGGGYVGNEIGKKSQ